MRSPFFFVEPIRERQKPRERLGAFPDLALRIGFVPITAAIAYELLRWGSRRRCPSVRCLPFWRYLCIWGCCLFTPGKRTRHQARNCAIDKEACHAAVLCQNITRYD